MNQEILVKNARKLVVSPKGLLAADESTPSCNARFEKVGISQTEEMRRQYRELLFTTPGLENYISGVILYDETIRQSTSEGISFPEVLKSKGIEVGIKVDMGLVDFPEHPGEKITQGLDGLGDRLKEYKTFGATFAKWRTVYAITDTTPSEELMKTNAEILAKYASVCQENDIVPIIEPEVLLDGNHSIEKCYEVTSRNLGLVFAELAAHKVYLPGLILKTNMIIPGKDSGVEVHASDTTKMTVKCLKEKVPAEVGGIVFLSGGQSDEDATMNLNAMHNLGPLPWQLTFSYSRALQNKVLKHWAEHPMDIKGAQDLLIEAAKNNSLASIGEYKK